MTNTPPDPGASNDKLAPANRKYVILRTNIFSKHEWTRLGCEKFQERGYTIRPLELLFGFKDGTSGLERGNFSSVPQVERITDKQATLAAFDELTPDDFILSMIKFTPDQAWIYRALSERGLNYAVLNLGAFQGTQLESWRTPKNISELMHLKLGDFRSLLRRSLNACRIMMNSEVGYSEVSAPYWWLRAGSQHPLLDSYFPKRWKANKIRVHSLDYETNLADLSRTDELFPGQHKGNYIVFLDQALADHPDYFQPKNLKAGISHPVTADNYFASMRRFLDKLENQTGAEVVVAAHTKASYDPQNNPFNRRLFYGETACLTRYASLAICSVTTSISYAVMHRKPILFFTTDELEGSKRLMGDILRMASSVDQKRINIDALDNNTEISIPEVDAKVYDSYMERFIKEMDVPDKPLWDIILDVLQKEGAPAK
jgi:hypothetical protein